MGKNIKFCRVGKTSEESRDFLCYGSPSIPSLPDLSKLITPTPQPYLFVMHSIWNLFLSGQMLWPSFVRPLGIRYGIAET